MCHSVFSLIKSKINLPEIEENIQKMAEMLLTTLDMRDKTTGQHCRAVALYSVAIGSVLELKNDDIKTLYIAGLFHDVGKFGVAEEILFKPGKLTAEEMESVKIHSLRSADIVRNITSDEELAYIIECHHERFDGSGYPHGLKGEDIPLFSRIITVADAFDAMTAKRCYKKSLTLDNAVLELKNLSFSQFDPSIVNAFINWLDNQKLLGAEKMAEKVITTNAAAGEQDISRVKQGLAWVKSGTVYVKDPEEGYPKATIYPRAEIQIFVNGKEINAPFKVSAADGIEIRAVEKNEPGQVKIRTSKDKLTAYLDIKAASITTYQLLDTEPTNNLKIKVQPKETLMSPASFNDIVKLLEQNNIKYGIDYNIIRKVVDFPHNGSVKVARGQAPTPPQDGRIKLFFEETGFNSHAADDKNNIDFKEINKIPTVDVGEPLALNQLPKYGNPGKAVDGELIMPREPVEYNLLAGKGTQIVEDGTKAIAVIEGMPKVLKSGKTWTVTVDSMLLHPGDVNMSTGNIRFQGSVQIVGSVDSDMSVSASGDILVNNLVTGSSITAGSNIVIKGNVVNSNLVAGGFEVIAKDLQPLLLQLHRYLDQIYSTAKDIYKHIPRTKSVRLGNILSLLKEKNLKKNFAYVNTVYKAMKKYDLKLLGTLENTLSGSINKLLGANLNQFNKLEEFKSVMDNLKSVTEYISAVEKVPSSINLTCSLNCCIKCSGSVYVKGPGCFNTEITCGGGVEIDGVFRGGYIDAKNDVQIGEAGSKMGTKTVISVPAGKRIRIGTAYPGTTIKIGKQAIIINETNSLTNVEYYLNKEGTLKMKSTS
ncbi:putative nucleotidyltransferase with HDIG domain [Desulfohalotomaculum tongense]|uniref:HD domain-containing phosphohydrolase n=1 Tax=Desulforadius tongensis TaxID=1216062 RepID=UPI0019571A4C|nr:HD domain-containing phosphohydrolase [Desulforadius tongensis]MBM7854597.1 putative nucleotidyltransferase with HDIG domain [Desulforadius tongensis]